MRCAQCNEVNAWTLAYCRGCGAPLAASASASPGAIPNPAVRPNPAAGPNPAVRPNPAAGPNPVASVRADGPPAPYGPQDASPAGMTGFAFDARRWTLTDQVTGGATLALLVSLFLPWFGTNGGFFSVSVDGMWHGYMVIDVVLALTILGYLVLREGFGSLPFGLSATTAERLLAGATGLNLLLAIVSFATKPVGTTWQYGAFVGLAAAIVAVALPVRSVRAARHG